ncbi:MAG TPA: hypothetical protein VHU87_14190 [Rhizomicrobium sp.]|jgi:hypothetical protein|nr:hypothetical protein [Rhizomicrobium sp.]
MSLLLILALAVAPSAPVVDSPDVGTCMRAAAVVAKSTVKDSDHDGCVCTVQQLHKFLNPGDYELHQKMEEIIATGADEKSFNTQLSDILKKRGMNQADADAFLTRSRTAEYRAQDVCNPSPLLR